MHLARLSHHWCASYSSLTRVCVPYAPLLSRMSALSAFFHLCWIVLIVSYGLRLKNFRKATGPNFIPLKVIKFASNVIDSHLYNIIIKDLEKNKYSEEPKRAWVRPIFNVIKKKNKIGNYRSISILNKLSKIYERCIQISCQLIKKSYGSNHWKKIPRQ